MSEESRRSGPKTPSGPVQAFDRAPESGQDGVGEFVRPERGRAGRLEPEGYTDDERRTSRPIGVLGRHDPGATAVPYMIPGFTDSFAYGRLGAVCYGFDQHDPYPGYPVVGRRPEGKGTRYRATVLGPGVTPVTPPATPPSVWWRPTPTWTRWPATTWPAGSCSAIPRDQRP